MSNLKEIVPVTWEYDAFGILHGTFKLPCGCVITAFGINTWTAVKHAHHKVSEHRCPRGEWVGTPLQTPHIKGA